MKRILLAKKWVLFCVFLLVLNLFFVVWMMMKNLDSVYTCNLLIDFFYLSICELLLFKYIFDRGFDIFDPIFFVSAIYLMMFFVTPIYDILTKNFYWFGYSLFKYGPWASTIAFLGYVVLFLVYSVNLKKKRRFCLKKNSFNFKSNNILKNKSFFLLFLYGMYFVALIANIFYLVNSGYGNLPYILTLGLIGSGNAEIETSNIGFISMFSYSLPTIVLLLWEYENKKSVKIVSFILMFMLQVARGYRFFIIQIIVTFAAYFYLKNKRRPRIVKMVSVLFIMTVFILVMTMFRDSIRSGAGVNFSNIDSEAVSKAFDAAFWDNLRIYQNVYGMVGVIPSKYPLVGLRQILIGTIVMTIPRAIWPNKISSYGGESLRTLIGGNLAAGQAYPAIGEYYYAFGVFGVIIFMAILGSWLKKLRDKYMHSQNPLDIIYYAVMLGCCLQLIIRGYFPSNFWYLLFAILPIWAVKLL